MSLNSDRLHSLASAIHAAAQATTLDALGEEAFPHLARALDASAALMFVVETDGDRPCPQAVAGEARALFPDYLENFAAEDPLFKASAADRRPIHLPLRHAGVQTFRRSRAYSDFYRANGFEDKLYMRFAGSHLTDGGATSMGFLRPSRLANFGDDELELAGLALPAFEGAARRISRAKSDKAFAAMEALACAAAPHATLALDRSGRILWLSPAAQALLGPCLGNQRQLPETLVGAARRLARFAVSGTFHPSAPPTFSARVDRGDGVLLDAELSIARTRQGEPIVAVSLAHEAPPRALVAQTAASYSLTPSESDVLALVARGLSNDEIAARLYVSLVTVKTHLTRVFRKLGVESRVQAALLTRKLG